MRVISSYLTQSYLTVLECPYIMLVFMHYGALPVNTNLISALPVLRNLLPNEESKLSFVGSHHAVSYRLCCRNSAWEARLIQVMMQY